MIVPRVILGKLAEALLLLEAVAEIAPNVTPIILPVANPLPPAIAEPEILPKVTTGREEEAITLLEAVALMLPNVTEGIEAVIFPETVAEALIVLNVTEGRVVEATELLLAEPLTEPNVTPTIEVEALLEALAVTPTDPSVRATKVPVALPFTTVAPDAVPVGTVKVTLGEETKELLEEIGRAHV